MSVLTANDAVVAASTARADQHTENISHDRSFPATAVAAMASKTVYARQFIGVMRGESREDERQVLAKPSKGGRVKIIRAEDDNGISLLEFPTTENARRTERPWNGRAASATRSGRPSEMAKRPLSPQEVLDAARLAVPALGMATVYRNFKLLVAEGAVRDDHAAGRGSALRNAESAHHHHFQCTTCSRVYDVPGCPGNLRRLAPRGFRVDHHDVTLYGRCSDCGKAQLRAAG